MNDIIINKIQSIQRCVERAREEYNKSPRTFDTNYSSQDAAILNVVRACEQCIDLANHIIKKQKMGIPTSSSESFELLQAKSIIDQPLMKNLKNMIHFRNIVIHNYQQINLEIVKSVIKKELNNLVLFGDHIMKFINNSPSL
jgi:uncharacterized protein YutE (UPF0331/DUF86 family)